MANSSAPLSSVLDDLKGSRRTEAVSAGEIIEVFQHRSLGFLLTLFGLVAALPIIGDIPGVSMLVATLILIVIAQSFLGGGSLWLPGFVARRKLDRDRFEKAIERSRPWVERVDRLLKPRLTALAAGRNQRWAISAAAAILAITFYPLAFVPFGVNVPALGVLALGLGMMACDGVFVLLGYGLSAVTVFFLISALEVRRLYVTHFSDHTVGVIELDPASPYFHQLIAEVR